MSESQAHNDKKAATRTANILLAAIIILAIVGATWWMGERNGWSSIGTGGSNAKLLPKVGEQAPEFFTLREDGQPVLLSQLRGQPVWINFWGSWCAPCRSEMPEFKMAYDKLTPQGIVILPVSIGEAPEQAIKYRDLVGATFPVYIDPSFIGSFVDADANPEIAAKFDAMRSDWQILNYPTHVFIDADGIVRQIVLAQMSEEEMIASATALLKPVAFGLPTATINRYD